MGTRPAQPVHDRDESTDTSPAPPDLEPLRAFLSLHDHEPGNPDSLPPAPDTLRWWLDDRGLLPASARVRRADVRWALDVREALRSRVREHAGAPRDERAAALLDRATERAGLRPRFGDGDGRFHVEATGIVGAIGRLLADAALAQVDGRWDRFRMCNDASCSAVFYDRSRNRSGKWCSMAVCGNRAKVRAFRERQAAG